MTRDAKRQEIYFFNVTKVFTYSTLHFRLTNHILGSQIFWKLIKCQNGANFTSKMDINGRWCVVTKNRNMPKVAE